MMRKNLSNIYAISGRSSRHIGIEDRIVSKFQKFKLYRCLPKHSFRLLKQQRKLRRIRKHFTYAHSTAPKTRGTKLLDDKHPFLIMSLLLEEDAHFLSSSHATSSAAFPSSVFCNHRTVSISVTVASFTFNMIFVT